MSEGLDRVVEEAARHDHAVVAAMLEFLASGAYVNKNTGTPINYSPDGALAKMAAALPQPAPGAGNPPPSKPRPIGPDYYDAPPPAEEKP